jgi:hypothetical protein
MAGKTDAERREELVGDDAKGINGSLKSILGAKVGAPQAIEAQGRARALLDANPEVIGKLHLGRLGRPREDKPSRDAIRTAMLLAWAISNDQEYALQMREFLKAMNRQEIEDHIANLWKYRIEPRAGEGQLSNNFRRKITLLEQEPLEFLKRYPLSPLGQLPSPVDLHLALQPIVDDAQVIMRFTTDHRSVNNPFPFMLDRFPIPAGAIPAYAKRFYFLPWKTLRIIQLQIPGPPFPPQTPSLFATAFLKGCSVFIEPPLNSPNIYHAGVEGVVRDISDDLLPDGANLRTRSARAQNKATAFWRELLMDLTNRMPRNLQGVGEVNKDMYSNNKREEVFLGRMRTALQRRGKNVAQFDQWGQSFGCVFGKREGNNWTFYLQQNVLLKYTSTGNHDITTMVPIYVARVIPNAATIWDGLLQKLPDNVDDPHLKWNL